MTRSVAPEPAAPPLVLRCPVVAITRPQPPAISITLPPSPAIAVEWPRVRVTQPRMPGRPSVIRLPARQQRTVRGPVPVPAFRAVELMRLHPRSRLASLCRSCAAAGIGTARSTATRPAGARRTGRNRSPGSRRCRRGGRRSAPVSSPRSRGARSAAGRSRSRCITSSRGRRAAVTSRGTCGACARPATRESPAGLEARHSRRPLTCGNAREFGRGQARLSDPPTPPGRSGERRGPVRRSVTSRPTRASAKSHNPGNRPCCHEGLPAMQGSGGYPPPLAERAALRAERACSFASAARTAARLLCRVPGYAQRPGPQNAAEAREAVGGRRGWCCA